MEFYSLMIYVDTLFMPKYYITKLVRIKERMFVYYMGYRLLIKNNKYFIY